MKKNILAPAVALSLGLTGTLGAVAAPAFADETPTNDQTAEGTDNGKTEENGEPKDGEGQPEEGAGGTTSTENGTEENGDENVETQAADGKLELSTTELTLGEAVTEGIFTSYTGSEDAQISFTVTKKDTGEQIGEKMSFKANHPPRITLDANMENPYGEYTVDYTVDGEEQDPVAFTVIESEGDPSVHSDRDEYGVEEATGENAIFTTLRDAEADKEVTFELRKKGSEEAIASKTETTTKAGTAQTPLGFPEGKAEVGDYEIVAKIGGEVIASHDIKVISDEDAAPDIPGSASLSTKKLSLSEAREKGIDAVYEGGNPGDKISFTLFRKGSDEIVQNHDAEVDDKGNAGANFKLETDDEHAEDFLGDYEVLVSLDYGNSADTIDRLGFSVVADEDGGKDEAPADPALKLSDKKITAADFVDEDKGIVATVNNLKPGTEVKFNVAGTSGSAKDVRPFGQTVKADKDGNAVFSVAGTSKDNPSAYLGKYSITAEFDGQKLEDSFEVVNKKNDDGKGDAEDGDKGGSEGGSQGGDSGTGGGSVSDDTAGDADSGSLPRTGQGLGALAAGAALLTIGGATVFLTRRSRKA